MRVMRNLIHNVVVGRDPLCNTPLNLAIMVQMPWIQYLSHSRPLHERRKDIQLPSRNWISLTMSSSRPPSSTFNSSDLEKQPTSPDQSPSNLETTLTFQSTIEHPHTILHEIGFITILCSSQLLTQAGLAQSIAPLRIIGSSFNLTKPGALSWFPAAYSLTVGTFILPAGRLGDVYGHKKLVVLGFLWFALWSVLAGCSVYAKTEVFFDVCRALQGLGPALLLPNCIAILGRAYKPGLKKSMVFSLFGAAAPSGFVLGAVFSSLLARFAWWPWSFWVLGLGLLCLGLCAFLVIPYTPPPGNLGGVSTWERLDALGGLMGVVGLGLALFSSRYMTYAHLLTLILFSSHKLRLEPGPDCRMVKSLYLRPLDRGIYLHGALWLR